MAHWYPKQENVWGFSHVYTVWLFFFKMPISIFHYIFMYVPDCDPAVQLYCCLGAGCHWLNSPWRWSDFLFLFWISFFFFKEREKKEQFLSRLKLLITQVNKISFCSHQKPQYTFLNQLFKLWLIQSLLKLII